MRLWNIVNIRCRFFEIGQYNTFIILRFSKINKTKHAKSIASTRSLCCYCRSFFPTDKVWLIVEMLQRDNSGAIFFSAREECATIIIHSFHRLDQPLKTFAHSLNTMNLTGPGGTAI